MIDFSRQNIRSWSIMGINPSIWSVGLLEILKDRKDIFILAADLVRYSGLERTFRNYPDQCQDLGIAEQNMVGVAAGMAMEGMQVFITTYAPFMTFRCADQFRHLLGNLKLNIKAIGSAAGLSAGFSGASLLAINDIAFARSVPNMVVLSPADCTEAVKMMLAMAEDNRPTYMRFCGAVRIPMVYDCDYHLEIGKAIILRRGIKIVLICTGTDIVFESLKAATILSENLGYCVSVVNMHTIKPIDTVCLLSLTEKHDIFVTIEEHSIIGGLGSAVSEFLVAQMIKTRQIIIGIEDKNLSMGSRSYMLEQCGLTAEIIAKRIIGSIKI